jgi:riboflavin kinase / FMN adenylyltransferase
VEIVRDTSSCPEVGDGAAVTIGAYDGLHLGHRAVIAEVRREAQSRDLASAVVTFDRHPAAVVRPETAPKLLCDLDQKLELLESTGIDLAVVVRFDEVRAAETAEEFVQEVLVDCLRARTVIVGADFHFGKGRGGNVALLNQLGPQLGFDVHGMALVDAEGRPTPDDRRVSSTAIRRALVTGDVEGAAGMLGRPHEVRGVVMPGDQRGRELGFPTANVAVPGAILLPADGIYAGWFRREDGTEWPTAISLCRRPTFYETADASLLEAHVLDFSGDLYDERVGVRFVARLRGEERFDSVDDLIVQMRRDCDEARRLLGTGPDQ